MSPSDRSSVKKVGIQLRGSSHYIFFLLVRSYSLSLSLQCHPRLIATLSPTLIHYYAGYLPTTTDDHQSNMAEGSMAEGSAKRKNILRDERGMPMVKSHPRLDVIGRRASSSSFQGTTRQQRL